MFIFQTWGIKLDIEWCAAPFTPAYFYSILENSLLYCTYFLPQIFTRISLKEKPNLT